MMQELTRGYAQTRVFMDTTVVIEISAREGDHGDLAERMDRAFCWFAEVEHRCSRFDEASELRSLCRRAGEPIHVSPILFHALHLSLDVAHLTGGALDPTVGRAMERSGFDTNYLTGEHLSSRFVADARGTYRDIHLDRNAQTVTLTRPLALDLGAVAKGLAIDLAAQELNGLPGFVVNAGGDIFACGFNPDGERWQVGVRHPRRHAELLASLSVTNAAVCTSGDYERPRTTGAGHHIIDPASGGGAEAAVSVTVVAPTAVVADALSTAVFVLGPQIGFDLLKREGVEGLIVGPDLDVIVTPGMEKYGSR